MLETKYPTLKLKTFTRIRRVISENTAILLYKSAILPVIDYNDVMNGLLTKHDVII